MKPYDETLYREPRLPGPNGAEARATCFHIADLADQPPPEFLVEGLYVERTFSLLYGPSKSGKTHLASQLVYDLARGTDHFDRPVKKQGSLILAGEGANAIGLRARAFAKYYDINLRDLDICVETARLDFLDERRTETVDRVLRAYEKLRNPGHILVDPWGKFLRSGDENSSVDVGRGLETAHDIMDRTGCSLTAIHHTPASTTQRPRGHTSLLADVEMAAAIVKNGARSMTVTEARFIPEGAELHFDLKSVPLDGGVSACVVVPAADAAAPVRLPSGARRALDQLHNTLATVGEPAPSDNHIPPLKRVVRWSVWRGYCITSRISSSDNPDSQQKAFSRAADKLKDLGFIGTWGEWVWTTDKTDKSGQSENVRPR